LKRKGAGYHHGDLRRALVEATIRLVDARGVDAFTLRAAAKLAGVSDGAPYHHFADKDSLLAAAAETGFARLGDEMLAAAEECDDDGSHSVAMGVAYVLFAAKHPAWFRLMFGRLTLQRQKHPELARAADRASGLVKQAIALRSGTKSPPEAVWYGSWAIVHGLSVLAIDGHLGATGRDPRKLERLVLAAIQSFTDEATRDSEPASQSRGEPVQASRRSSRPPPASEAPPLTQRRARQSTRERGRVANSRR
jgi:AcrR family transcriptional regulator